MTILPKKKVTKEKAEGDNVDHHNRLHPHQSTSENRHEKVARVRNSPTRWLPTPGREEAAHDPGGAYDPHESTSGHNKRRHRSSPHRNHSRKHRGGHVSTVASHTPPQASAFEEEEARQNSDDEYVPPTYPENVEEVRIYNIEKLQFLTLTFLET